MGYTHTILHKMCENWKNMLDFPNLYGWNISPYFLADYCAECRVWFPKNTIKRWCPCCKARLRTRSPKFAMTQELREQYQKELDLFKAANPNWTLIKMDKLMKPIIDLKIVKGLL